MKGVEEAIDRCDAIDVLEAAVTTRRSVELALRGGDHLAGRVVDLTTEGDEDWAVLEDGRRVALSDIRDVKLV